MHHKQEADECRQDIPMAIEPRGIAKQSISCNDDDSPGCDGVNAFQHEPVDCVPQCAPLLRHRSGKHKHGGSDCPYSPCLWLASLHVLLVVAHLEVCSLDAMLVVE
jgi:hypothetical protein